MGVVQWVDTFRNRRVVDLADQRAGGIVHDPRTGWGLTPSEVAVLLEKVGAFTAADMHRTQPNLRTVVDYTARNVAQLGIHSFVRQADDSRVRDRSSVVAGILGEPSPVQTEYELVYSIVADLALFDECWLMVVPVPRSFHRTGWVVRPLPVAATHIVSGSEWSGDLVVETTLDGADPVRIPWGNLIHLHGWNPAYSAAGTSPLDALKGTLSEQIAAQAYRLGVWKNGGLASGYIYRPKDAPEWSEKGKGRFVEGLREFMRGGPQVGGMPLLEDGMEMRSNTLNAKEQQFLEVAQLSLETVARVYHINPAMLGATGGITYANMREFRKGLYGETLGPTLEKVQQKLNARLLGIVGSPAGEYLEFNLRKKLAGDFEAEGAVLQGATGGPYMTVNEARARQNLPRVEGGDELLAPLNMTARGGGDDEAPADERTADEVAKLVNAASALIRSGFDPTAALEAVGLDPVAHLGLLPVTVQKPVEADGTADEELEQALKGLQALEFKSHRVTATITLLGQLTGARKANALEHKGGATRRKAAPPEHDEQGLDLVRGVFAKTAARQRAAVLSALGSKAGTGWWDEDRWNEELAADLYAVAATVSGFIGADVAEQLGFKGAYTVATTLAFLRAVAESRAGMVNATTRDALAEALAAGEDPGPVFDQLAEARGEESAVTFHSTVAAFATAEAAKHVARAAGGDDGPAEATKTWVVRSGNPRKAHASMNGETVGIDEKFSNGADWPGDPVLGADGVAGCLCSVAVEVNVP